ncbi:MAG TPA: PAS domain S-box protein, partial [Geobacteraceae bacterium]
TLEEGRIIEVNDAFESVFKYKREEAIGRSALDLNIWADPDDRTRVIQTLHESGEVRDCEIRFRDRGGNVFVGLYSATITEIGGEECLLSILSDITERKRLEEEREQLLTQLDAVLNSIHEGVVISDLEGNVLTMNPAALAMYGFESVEQVRRQLSELQNVFELFDLDGRPLPLEQRPMLRVLRGERFSDCELRVQRKDTGKSWIASYSGTPVYSMSGDVILAVTTMRDITGRKRSEEALRESEARFSSIFNMAPVAIAISALADGRFVDINAAGERLTGYRRDEVIGRTALEFDIWSDPLQRANTVEDLLERGEVRDREVAMKNKGGVHFWGSFSAVIIDVKGEKYMLSLVSDISERKRAEAEIEKLNTSLAARAAELEAANRELETFSYTVSHDLRRPLTVINGYCQVIREMCGVTLGEPCRGYLEEIYGGTQRMNQLIDALLRFSSMTRVELRREMVDLSAMAQVVAAELRRAEPQRRVTFRIAEGIMVTGDVNLLRVVVENLLGNAWKYTGQREEGVIELGVAQFDGKPACFIRDNGAGFAMAEAERLFIPFQRLSGSAGFKGHGIGLATVERIIRRHGGRIWAEGEPERGATFFFTLPEEGPCHRGEPTPPKSAH